MSGRLMKETIEEFKLDKLRYQDCVGRLFDLAP